MLARLHSFALSFLFVFITVLALFESSAYYSYIEFWAVYLAVTLVITLPLLYMQSALVTRSKESNVLGMQKLTREADVSMQWRKLNLISLFALVMVISASVHFLTNSVQVITHDVADIQGIFAQVPAPVVILAAVAIVSFVALYTSFLASLVAIALAVYAVATGSNSTAFVMGGINAQLVLDALSLAVISSGCMTTVYWHSLNTVRTQCSRYSHTNVVVPMLIAQFVAVASASFIQQTQLTFAYSEITVAVVCLIAIAAIFNVLVTQCVHAFGNKIYGFALAVFACVISCMLWLYAPSTLLIASVKQSVVLAGLVLAIFVGWKMKISHLRKALGFGSELSYNLWRIAIRILVPLVSIAASAGIWFTFI